MDAQNNIHNEYVCKLRTTKHTTDYTNYKFYDKSIPYRIVTFLHRGVANIFLRAYLKLVHKAKVTGKQNVANLRGGAVIVSNHIHPLDITMIDTLVFGMRQVRWLTLQRNFDLSVACLIRNSGGVPIPEDHDQKKRCMLEMNELLRDGGLLHICPEGSLVELCDQIRPFKDGAFRFAYTNGVPIVPITLRFVTEGRDGKKFRKPHFIIDVAEPIYPTVPQDVLKEKTTRVMKRHSIKAAPQNI